MKIRTIIIDDESRSRKGIRARLAEYTDVQIIGECSSGNEAVETINKLIPDLLFLDIQMPELNGFDVLGKITAYPMPIVIFVTAYDQYAVQAFEYHALDYLLKPIAEDRFRDALSHSIKEIERRKLSSYPEKLRAMINDYFSLIDGGKKNAAVKQSKKDQKYITRLMIKNKNDISIINVDEIIWIESAGDLVFIHTKSKKHVYRETLSKLEEELDPKHFIRIHRSAIVNLEKVKQLHPVSHGDFDVQLENDVKIRLSRSYRSKFQNALQTG
jgi:two-component system, LytTR family, response regulator